MLLIPPKWTAVACPSFSDTLVPSDSKSNRKTVEFRFLEPLIFRTETPDQSNQNSFLFFSQTLRFTPSFRTPRFLPAIFVFLGG